MRLPTTSMKATHFSDRRILEQRAASFAVPQRPCLKSDVCSWVELVGIASADWRGVLCLSLPRMLKLIRRYSSIAGFKLARAAIHLWAVRWGHCYTRRDSCVSLAATYDVTNRPVSFATFWQSASGPWHCQQCAAYRHVGRYDRCKIGAGTHAWLHAPRAPRTKFCHGGRPPRQIRLCASQKCRAF